MANEMQGSKAGKTPAVSEFDQVASAPPSQQEVADYIQDVSLQLYHLAKHSDLEMLAHLFGMIVIETQDPRRPTH